MSRTAIFVYIILMLLLALISAHSQVAPSIEGVVKNGSTNEYLVGARLTLERVPAESLSSPARSATDLTTPDSSHPTVISDANGRFRFGSLEPGSYRLTIMSNGFVRQEYTQKVIGGPVPSMVLRSGQAMTDVVVQMIPAGTVSGQIQNSSGRPISGILVQLLRRTYSSSGKSSLQSVASARTNDLGEYRMYWVTPGHYDVMAMTGSRAVAFGTPAQRFDQDAMRGNNDAQVSYAEVFYRGATEVDRADVIDVQPGEEVNGINLTVALKRLYHIRGRVMDPRTGKGPPRATITFFSASAFVSGRYDAASGTMEATDLAPGMYVVTVSLGEGANLTERMSATVIIANSDIDDLILTAEPSVIQGQIKVESSLPLSKSLSNLRVQLTPGNPALPYPEIFFGGNPLVSNPNPDGTFMLTGVPNGEFRVTLPTLPSGLYLKEATLDGADVLNAAAGFSGPKELKIVVSSNGGQIDGRAVDERSQPVSGIQAVLVPDTPRERPELFKSVTTDPEGRFKLSDISPGEYKLFAWEALEPFTYFDPDVLKKFEQDGKPVHIEESSRQTVDVKMIPAERVP